MAQVDSCAQGSDGSRPASISLTVVNERRSSSSLGKGDKLNKSYLQSTWTARDFTFGRLFGHGSYSKVYHAILAVSGEDFAVKVMDKRHIIRENKVQYVKLEKNILNQLDHSGVVKLRFTFQDESSLYMGLECCKGGELFQQIQKWGKMPVAHAQFYAAEVVETLEYIHSQGIVHRDLKPENILLTSDGHMKLVDFGSAKLLRHLDGVTGGADQDDRNSSFVGTAEYVSPEVLNSQPVTTGADMWALGCIIFQMLEGRPPFRAASEYLCFQKVIARDVTIPDHFPPHARDLIEKLLDMDPLKRPGADTHGYSALKAHPFFASIHWPSLRSSPAPTPLPLPSPSTSTGGEEGCVSDDVSDGEDWEMAHLSGTFSNVLQGGGNFSNLPTVQVAAEKPETKCVNPGKTLSGLSLGKKKAKGGEGKKGGFRFSVGSPPVSPRKLGIGNALPWSKVLNPDEGLLISSLVYRKHGLTPKKSQLLLTDGPRLLFVDPLTSRVQTEVKLNAKTRVEAVNLTRFTVCTPHWVYTIDDLEGQAFEWKTALDAILKKEQSGPYFAMCV